jgi:hypothetical protein
VYHLLSSQDIGGVPVESDEHCDRHTITLRENTSVIINVQGIAKGHLCIVYWLFTHSAGECL